MWSIKQIDKILKDEGADMVDGVLIDMQTANAVKRVFQMMCLKNRKIAQESIPITQFADFCWSKIKI